MNKTFNLQELYLFIIVQLEGNAQLVATSKKKDTKQITKTYKLAISLNKLALDVVSETKCLPLDHSLLTSYKK